MTKHIPTTKQEAADILLPWVERQLQRGSGCFKTEGYNPHPRPRVQHKFKTIVLRFLDPSDQDYYFWVKFDLPEPLNALATHDEDFPIMMTNLTMQPYIRNYAKFLYKELVEAGKCNITILGNFLTHKVISEETADNLAEMSDELTQWMKGDME